MYGERIQKKVGNINLDAVACAVDDNNIVYTIIYFFTNTKEETISKLSEIYGDYEIDVFSDYVWKITLPNNREWIICIPSSENCIVMYDELATDEMNDKTYKMYGRTLTSEQREIIQQVVESLDLYLDDKLTTEEVVSRLRTFTDQLEAIFSSDDEATEAVELISNIIILSAVFNYYTDEEHASLLERQVIDRRNILAVAVGIEKR